MGDREARKRRRREDCLELMDRWPGGDESHLFPEEPAFEQLPASIRLLEPVYVTKDDLYGPSIGICKNGWAGFRMGVRVFAEDEDAEAYTRSAWIRMEAPKAERIVPNVYLWIAPT